VLYLAQEKILVLYDMKSHSHVEREIGHYEVGNSGKEGVEAEQT
jgi:hypothetical protein